MGDMTNIPTTKDAPKRNVHKNNPFTMLIPLRFLPGLFLFKSHLPLSIPKLRVGKLSYQFTNRRDKCQMEKSECRIRNLKRAEIVIRIRLRAWLSCIQS